MNTYPTHHSWIITTHISLGDLEKQWKMFIQQKARSQQLLNSLQWKLPAPCYTTHSITGRINKLGIFTSYKPLTLTATQLLKREPSFNGMSPFCKYTKRTLLPFLRDALSWLTRTATMGDVRDIKKRVNQLIGTQTQQQETLVHVILILNITRYAAWINRQHINTVTEAVERTHNDGTMAIYTHINYQQILLHACSILDNLRDSLYYMRQIAMHAMDYIDAVQPLLVYYHCMYSQ